jgi:hypothetical protein
MRRQQRPSLQPGCVIHPFPGEPGPLRAHPAGAFDYLLLNDSGASINRRFKRAPGHIVLQVNGATESLGVLWGFGTLYRSKAGRKKGNRVYE